MAKCDVCGNTSLFPERFGTVNVCKVCFLKTNGLMWKHQYDRYEDAEQKRCKALESAHAHNFPQIVISSINEFFVSQINSMDQCECCGEYVSYLQKLTKSKICKRCFGKINTSAWNKTEYEDNDEVETNREKILTIASKNNFSPIVIEEINTHFNSKIQQGLVCIIDGGVGQVLKVYESHCVLITNKSFNVEEMSKRYGKALKLNKGSSSSFRSNAAKALALGTLIPGSTIIKTGMRAAASAAITVAADKFITGKVAFKVIKGEFKLDYHNYDYADYNEGTNAENDIGFVRFIKNSQVQHEDVVFLFSNNRDKANKAYSAICRGIDLAHQVAPTIQELNISVNNNNLTNSSTSVADEILKFKQLLDIGAITQEEFDTKKKELLNL